MIIAILEEKMWKVNLDLAWTYKCHELKRKQTMGKYCFKTLYSKKQIFHPLYLRLMKTDDSDWSKVLCIPWFYRLQYHWLHSSPDLLSDEEVRGQKCTRSYGPWCCSSCLLCQCLWLDKLLRSPTQRSTHRRPPSWGD